MLYSKIKQIEAGEAKKLKFPVVPGPRRYFEGDYVKVYTLVASFNICILKFIIGSTLEGSFKHLDKTATF